MTYNFDPDRWYDNERLRLEMRRREETLSAEELASALEDLDRRYDEMVTRLDGTFAIARQKPPDEAHAVGPPASRPTRPSRSGNPDQCMRVGAGTLLK
jgi:hypothetical protein